MAKDKSKKKDLDDDFGAPSEAPAGGESWRMEDESNIGKLLLISPLRVKNDAVGFENQISEVIVADVVVIDEKKPERSEEHEGVWVWGGWTKGALRGFVGEKKVLARLEQDKSKGRGKNAAWVLEDASKKDADLARAYLASVDVFAQKGAKKSKAADEDDEPKKGKKAEPDKKAKGKKK